VSSLPHPARKALIILSIALSALVAGFGLGRALGAGKILGDVAVLDVDLGRMTPDQALAALGDLEDRLNALPASFTVKGKPADLEGAQVDFTLDRGRMVDEAMAIGRTGNISSQFRQWLRSLFTDIELPVASSIDDELADEVFDQWDAELVANPAFEGAVLVEAGSLAPQYPKEGEGIDRTIARTLLLAELSTLDRSTATLPVVAIRPRLTATDVDRALAEARLWTKDQIILATAEIDVVFSPEQLLAALRSRPVEQSPPRLELFFDPDAIAPVLTAVQAQVEQAPVDARFLIDGYDVSIAPGQRGTLIDPGATAQALAAAASTAGRTGTLPVEEGAEPTTTTETLEALDVRHLVASFTTYHDCCQNRVVNIHLIADKVDGVLVGPGDTFDLNAFVGQRTTEAGYLEDGTIEGGEIVKTVGGGVSQFATTFYNAVFWGGYEDVTHKPHSFYFSRYPEGIEATISWPAPDLAFRNDSASAVLIKTEYTDTSITVQFYGNNDGRVVVGSHRGGNTEIAVAREGGPEARKVTSTRSDRYSPTEPTTRYRANPEVEPGTQKKVQSPAGGWSVTITRTIARGGTTETQEWAVRYSAKPEIIELNPCEMPGTTVTCPTTTTVPATTTPPTTTG
jgi:VanW like protein/Putative peptidoglycan binding domain